METKNWKWFRYDEIFDIKKGKRLTKANMVNGDIPYIGATDSNNGITARVSNSEHLHSANTITVSYNGSIAEAYYQTKMFWATDDVNVLYPKFEMTPFSALFLTTIINKEKYRFNYGRKWDKELMQVSKIKLPIDKTDNPDWQWIEKYVKESLIPKLPTKVKSVWDKNFDNKPLSSNKLELNTKDWKWFRIGDYFDKPYKATAYNAIELITCPKENKDSIAYITRTDANNGCKDYVINEGFTDIESGNAITIGDTTATIYYQENDFICGDHMVVLRSSLLNKYVGLFITSLLNKERFRYNYGRAFNKGILSDTKLKLPATKNAQGEYEPDWQWMEDYIKGLPYSRNI
jgi:hypothetical protein